MEIIVLIMLSIAGAIIAIAFGWAMYYIVMQILGVSIMGGNNGIEFILSEHSHDGNVVKWIFPLIDPETGNKFTPRPNDVIKIATETNGSRTYVYHNGRLCQGFPEDKNDREKYFNTFPERQKKLNALLGIDPLNFELENATKKESEAY